MNTFQEFLKIARRLIILTLLVLALMPVISVFGQSSTQTVYVISIDGEITPAMAARLEKTIEKADDAGAAGILIEVQTLGGRVVSAIQMRDAIIASETPVAVYIESRAISAGALISIAARTIIMAPGSHMGSAQPIPNDPKTLAYVSGEFKTTAERTGRDPVIALAMVDESVEVEGLVGQGEILDLTANEAAQYGFADHIVSGRNEVLKVLSWDGAQIIEEKTDYKFQIAQFLTSTEVASLLLSLGMLALLVELFTPGFGVPGFVGIACFALYFSSGFIAGYTNLWSVGIFFAGVILLLIELVVPGFGVFGISGLIAMFVGIVLAAPTARQGILSLLVALLASVLAIPILLKVFGKSRFLQRLVLEHSETVEQGYVHTPDKSYLIGRTGETVTVLRPSGMILVDGNRIDAIAEGEFINSGTNVKVVKVEGSRVVVSTVADS